MGPVMGEDVTSEVGAGVGVGGAGDRAGWSGSPPLRLKDGNGVAGTPLGPLPVPSIFDFRCRVRDLFRSTPQTVDRKNGKYNGGRQVAVEGLRRIFLRRRTWYDRGGYYRVLHRGKVRCHTEAHKEAWATTTTFIIAHLRYPCLFLPPFNYVVRAVCGANAGGRQAFWLGWGGVGPFGRRRA